MSRMLTDTEFTNLKARLDDQMACAWWDKAIFKKWRIRGNMRQMVSDVDARVLYLFKFVVDTWDHTEGAYNYITEQQLVKIFKKANEISNC